MSYLIPIDSAEALNSEVVGGKGAATARLVRMGIPVPKTICLSTKAYLDFLSETGLKDRIALEIHRKDFIDMRWEEIWDAALRIRNMFLKSPMPLSMRKEIIESISSSFSGNPLAVRSSAPSEDSDSASFAGLHESYLNLKEHEDVLKHILLVWASLWSDGALLYRRELGLSPSESSMAVLIQEMIPGDRSGIVFTVSPDDPKSAMIESVYGLNQGLVDGTIEPDRWLVNRADFQMIHSMPTERKQCVRPKPHGGTEIAELSESESLRPPLSTEDVKQIALSGMLIERQSNAPQDVEWTIKNDELVILQARAITSSLDSDDRKWYLTLRRSLENLKKLREKVEKEVLPAMDRAARLMEEMDLSSWGMQELAKELKRRYKIYQTHKKAYWDSCIPLAHGFRLFGEVYNDRVKPEDPYEFVLLLSGADFKAKQRNDLIIKMARLLKKDPRQFETFKIGKTADLSMDFRSFARGYQESLTGVSSLDAVEEILSDEALKSFIIRLASGQTRLPDRANEGKDINMLLQGFYAAFGSEAKSEADEILELGRASYRLRDDDNLYLKRIERQVQKVRLMAQEMLRQADDKRIRSPERDLLEKALLTTSQESKEKKEQGSKTPFHIKARQIRGQPASKGVSNGRAYVAEKPYDFSDFKSGDILVCDAIDPDMTYIVPLASGIVERRGGMLIHGAIIAREYGIPCVTGIPDATHYIRTGNWVTVDGFLGIVTIRGGGFPDRQ
jgi:pyruvate,water dikinase